MPDDFPYEDFERNGIHVLRDDEVTAAVDKLAAGPFVEGPAKTSGPIRSGQHRLAHLADEQPRIDVPPITCPACGQTSYNPVDIQERYCGACHDYHRNLT